MLNQDTLVMFCILMQTGEGILGKAPSYIGEKFAEANMGNTRLMLTGLDQDNTRKYWEWKARWDSGSVAQPADAPVSKAG